jgi:hypothetical protein
LHAHLAVEILECMAFACSATDIVLTLSRAEATTWSKTPVLRTAAASSSANLPIAE